MAYDRWKTTPPEPEEIPVCECEHCGETLCAGMEVVVDDGGAYFCDTDCARRYTEEHLQDVLEDYEDWYDYADNCLYTVVLEPPEPDY